MRFQLFNKIIVLFFAIFLMATAVSDVQAQGETNILLGNWVGGYEIDGNWHFVEAHFEQNGDDLLGGLDFRFDMKSVTFVSNSRAAGTEALFPVTLNQSE